MPAPFAEFADAGEHPMQMVRRCRLRLDQDVIGSGTDKVFDVALRLDDHEVHVQRLGGRPAHCLDHDRAEADVRDEAPVHDVDKDPVGAGRVDSADLFGEATEVRRKNRGSDNERLHMTSQSAQALRTPRAYRIATRRPS